VASWVDSSGNGNTATQGLGDNRPTWHVGVVNGQPAVRFVASQNDYLNIPNVMSGFTAAEVFVVLKNTHDPNPTGGYTGIWNFSPSTISPSHYPWTTGTIFDGFGTTARKTVGDPSISLAQWRLYNVSSQAGEWVARLNTSTLFSTATNTTGFPTTPKLGASILGVDNPAGSVYYSGDMAEVIVFDEVLTAGRRSEVETYLCFKYNLGFCTSVPPIVVASTPTPTASPTPTHTAVSGTPRAKGVPVTFWLWHLAPTP